MANTGMTQDRRDAMHWAEEWRIKQRNKRILLIVVAVLAVALLAFIINYVSIMVSRTTYASEEEMKAALQGRYETDYAEDIVIDGDSLTLTYYNQSHYDLEYAEKYGYSDYEDSVYDDEIVEWDYRRGQIKLKWMDTITVDKSGNLVYYHQQYKKTNEPKPTPLDPSLLSQYKQGYEDGLNAGEEDADSSDDAASGAGLTEEEQEAQDAVQESQDETQAAAEEAGVEPLPEAGDDV
ncbi:MAG: hypothetical protein IJY32_01965 [Mogibacterium sp.]|nr:hypothetical protein [Mogibacterium sp.]